MPLAVPSSITPASNIAWVQFFTQLGRAAGRPLPVAASIISKGHEFYPSLKIIADQYSVTIPSPAIPITSGGLISKDWYPALQRLAENA